MTHRNEKELVGIAQGKTLQFYWAGHAPEWIDFEPMAHDGAAQDLLSGGGRYEFRIKPHTVKIGSREVEAPVLEPVAGQELWYWQPDADEPRPFIFRGPNTAVSDALSYASCEACVKAHNAMVEYVKGQLA